LTQLIHWVGTIRPAGPERYRPGVMASRLLGSTAFAAVLASLPAQVKCATCGGDGLVACGSCDAGEREVEQCSATLACKGCGGARAAPCAACDMGHGAGAALDARRAAAREWLAARQQATGFGGKAAAVHVRTAHFELCLAGAPAEAADELHRAAHRCAAELETLRALLVEKLGGDAAAGVVPGTRAQVAIVRERAAAARLAADWAGVELQGLGKLRGDAAPALVLLREPKLVPDDAALQRLLAFHGARLVLAPLFGVPDERGGGWLESGIAHWCEAEIAGGRCMSFAALDWPQPPQRFWDGDWRTGARALLEQDRLPTLADVVGRDTEDLDFAQHVTVFAFVDWLLAAGTAPAITGGAQQQAAAGSRLGELVRSYAAAAARGAQVALPAWLADRAAANRELDRQLREFVRARYPKP
jgi:hypothetical protein